MTHDDAFSKAATASGLLSPGVDRRLPRSALRAAMIHSGIVFAVAIVAQAAIVLWLPVAWVVWVVLWILIPISVLVFLLDIVWINRRQFRSYSYRIDGGSLTIRKGFAFTSVTTIAAVQVLNVGIVRGPILRALGLAYVKLGTIGEPVVIGPVELAAAEDIRQTVLHKIGEAVR